ncbi:MAG TPA: hypothetical protein VKZ76_08380, partial [Edaphocola sp.]|nr:hypothetical protein [Edaphocola sp.]
MNKYLVNILVVVVVILAFNSCKKDYMNAPSSFQTMSGEADMSKYIGIWDASRPIRNTNPYSIATIREVKSILAGFENEDIAAIGNSTLNSSNYQLYCRIDIENTDNNIVLNQWLADDSNRTVVDFPLDSVAMYPEIFEEAGIADNFYQTKYAYTTVWLGDELPTGAEIIDTLYVPNSAENQDDLFLDFMAHILTSNISP